MTIARMMTSQEIGRPRETPPKEWLQKAYEAGLSYKEMVTKWHQDSGVWVTPDALRSAASRARVAGKRVPRYPEYLPWTVRAEHSNKTEAKCLRLAARKAAGAKLTDREDSQLVSFLRALREQGAVITYDRDTDQGWWWVTRKPSDGESLIREDPLDFHD